jgi:hypothetical protein
MKRNKKYEKLRWHLKMAKTATHTPKTTIAITHMFLVTLSQGYYTLNKNKIAITYMFLVTLWIPAYAGMTHSPSLP